MTMLTASVIFVLLFFFVGYTEGKEKKYGCVLPKEPWYGTFVFNDRRKSLRYKCDEGYALTGSIYQKDRKCRRGKWTGEERDCFNTEIYKKLCPVLRDPKNGKVIVEGRKKGQRANYQCDQGFVLEGSEKRTCRNGRTWDGIAPVCSSRRTIEDFANHLQDKMIDPLAASTIGSETGAQSRLSPGKRGLDIVLLVDTSASIGQTSLDSAKQFMKLLVDLFGVSEQTNGGHNGTRFALITFSNEAEIVFNLDDSGARTKDAVKNKIDNIKSSGGGTNFRNALANVFAKVYMPTIAKKEQRKLHGNRAVFLITDAEETVDVQKSSLTSIKTHADALKQDGGFDIFTIGVGQHIDKFVLGAIASTPQVQHVFLISDFENLAKIGNIIAEKDIDYRQCGISGKTEIPQGTQNAAKGAWPWIGWLTVRTGHGEMPWTCGGALLCDRWFLTAASCVSKKVMVNNTSQVQPVTPSYVNLYLGDYRLYKKDDEEILPIVRDVLLHENYTGEEVSNLGVRLNDVALLDLGENNKTKPSLNKFIRPLCFATDEATVKTTDALLKAMLAFPKDRIGFTSGWGHSPNSAKDMYVLDNKMRQNQRPLQKTKVCRQKYPELDQDRFFCVGDEFKENEKCQGDIGGPYVAESTSKRYYALGLALNTRDCAKLYHFSIFLNLLHPSVYDWVEPILNGCSRETW